MTENAIYHVKLNQKEHQKFIFETFMHRLVMFT